MSLLYIDFNRKNSFTSFTYPAGERQVRLTPLITEFLEGVSTCIVRACLRSSTDIVDLALLKDALDEVLPKVQKTLEIPYLPYSRADRRFVKGDCLGIATMARFLFSMSWDKIVTVDTHSSVAADWIPSLECQPATKYIHEAINNFCFTQGLTSITVVLPDEGASKRYQIPSMLGSNVYGIEVKVVECSKKRDAETGKLLGFTVPTVSGPSIIVDDLCDGGGTFEGIGSQLPDAPRGLYVTHGIFSMGLESLQKLFTKIYTTDSYCNLTSSVCILPIRI